MTEARLSEAEDWTRSRRGELVGWGLPIAAMIVGAVLEMQAALWPPALAWMGLACLANARRCGRMHCFFTGPFFLAMAALALLVGLGFVSLGEGSWSWIGGATLVGAVLLTYLPERLWGRYAARGQRARGDR